jgi:DNA replication protein DnaC
MKPSELPPLIQPDADARLSRLFNAAWQKQYLRLQHHNPKIRILSEEVELFCKNVIRQIPATLTLSGNTGTAKTHCLKRVSHFLGMAALWAWENNFWTKPFQHSFINWSDIAEEDRDDNDLYFMEANHVDILLLDDIGCELDRFKTGEPRERLRQLLGHREKKFNLITTNVPAAQWSNKWDARVEDRLLRNGARVVDLWDVPSFAKIA